MGSFYIMNTFEMTPPFLRINILQREPEYTLDCHSHDFFHVNLITHGSVCVETAEKCVTVPGGFAFIMPPRVEHRLYSKSGYMQIGADISTIRDFYSVSNLLTEMSCGKLVKIAAGKQEISEVITEKNLGNPSPFTAMKCTNALTSFIIYLSEGTREQTNRFHGDFSEAVKEAGYNCTLEELCRKLSYSKTHLNRMVKQEFGCSVMEYVNRMRFSEICNLLMTSEEPLYSIAENCGFYDSAHMSVFFKKRSGISPIKYRNEYR